MNFLRWIKQLATPPASTGTPTMEGAHAHRCRECALHFHLSPLSLATCPRCQSSHIFHIESWLRTPGEQVAHAATRRSQRVVKAINGGVPKPLPKKIVVLNSDGTIRTMVSNHSSSTAEKGTQNG